MNLSLLYMDKKYTLTVMGIDVDQSYFLPELYEDKYLCPDAMLTYGLTLCAYSAPQTAELEALS